jgi:hypothetical protein
MSIVVPNPGSRQTAPPRSRVERQVSSASGFQVTVSPRTSPCMVFIGDPESETGAEKMVLIQSKAVPSHIRQAYPGANRATVASCSSAMLFHFWHTWIVKTTRLHANRKTRVRFPFTLLLFSLRFGLDQQARLDSQRGWALIHLSGSPMTK